MILFKQKTEVMTFEDAAQFVRNFKVNDKDFILTSQAVFDRYFKPLDLDAQVVYKNKYGKCEPTDSMVDALLQDFRETSCKRIIAVGGGAVMDMAKILTLAGTYCAADYYQQKVPLKKERELIAIPTTCGSGSEVTNISIAEISAMQTKYGLAADPLYPDYAVLIPQLLTDLPYEYFAASAIDALIHAVESYLSPKATVYTEVYSRQAIQMILSGFQKLDKQGSSYRTEIIEEFLLASNLAGIAFGSAGTGTVHAMSYPLSGIYHVAHGEANYQFFAAVLRTYMRLEAAGGKMTELNKIISDILGAGRQPALTVLEHLLDRILDRKPLREYGMKAEEAEVFTDSIIKSQQRLLVNSCVPLSRTDILNIYRKLY